MPPLVTIVTPSLNQGRFIERTIESVLAQDHAPLEYVILDGGSTDGTPEILRRYEGRARISIGPDGGQAEAIDRGLRAARGEVVAWLNSDDVYAPGAVRAAVEALTAHPDAAMVYGEGEFIDAGDRPLGRYPTSGPERLGAGCVVCQPAAFLRREAVARVGFLDTSLEYCMDYDLWLRLAARHPVVRIPFVLASYRIHRESKSMARRLAFMREVVAMTHRRLGKAPLFYLYAYANLLVVERLGARLPVPLRRAAALAVASVLVPRYHRWPTATALREAREFERGPWPGSGGGEPS